MTPASQEHHMTTTDPRTDLAGYLGLTDDQAEDCRRSAPFHPGSVHTKIGARLIEQDQARDAEPDDGLIPVTVRLTADEVKPDIFEQTYEPILDADRD